MFVLGFLEISGQNILPLCLIQDVGLLSSNTFSFYQEFSSLSFLSLFFCHYLAEETGPLIDDINFQPFHFSPGFFCNLPLASPLGQSNINWKTVFASRQYEQVSVSLMAKFFFGFVCL